MSKTAFSSNDFIINAGNRYKTKMTEQCTDLMHNSEKLTFSSENLDIANEIDCVDEKESLLNFPFDHMYACNSDNSELTNNCTTTGESEVKHLKELLLVHLDLIQQQSEQLINKDKQIRSLKRENEMLKQRLDRMERRVINHITNNSNIHSNNKVEVFKNENHHHQDTKDDIVSQHKENNTLYTDNIYTENICEDTKSDIKLLDIHLPHNNIVNNDSGESQDHNNKVVEHDDDDLDQEFEEDIVSQHSEHSEEETEPAEHENMVTEMRVKRNNSSDGGGGMIEKPVKCYKSRSLINRNRSPPCSGNALSKLREELSKPVLSKRSSKTGDQQQQSEQQQQQQQESQTSQSQINNENSNVEASSSMKSGDNRRSRHRKNRINAKRKRLCSGNSMLSNNSSNDCKKSKVSFVKRDTILTTEQMYCTQMGSSSFCPSEDKDSPLDSASTTTNLEVPSWRIKVFTSCYSMEGTENLDDDVFNKRHLRLENDERRRKRWDVQRIREQRHIEKLKQRQERVGSGGRTDDHISEPPTSLWPSLDDIKYIEITEHLPVTAFGVPIAQFTPSEFSLPWLNESSNSNNNTSTNIPSTKKSKKKSSRRRSNKR